MKMISQFTVDNVKQVHQLFKQEWWCKERTLQETEYCINGSQVCIGITDDEGNLIAFARIISDFIYKALIFDVIVCSSHRGNGLGKKLMNHIENHEQLKHVKHFELYCLPEMEEFYASFGFSSKVGGIKLMRRTNV